MTSSIIIPALPKHTVARTCALALVASSLLVGCPSEPDPDAGAADAGVDAGLETDAGPERNCTEGTADDSAPTFGGVTGAVSDGPSAVILTWDPATDDDTDPSAIRYRIFIATTGSLDFSMWDASVRGSSGFRVSGLEEGVSHRFVVRAEDRAGQRECNEVEVEATPTPITGCIDYATWIQPMFDANCSSCHGGATADLRRGLRLDSLDGVRAGGLSGQVIEACRPERSLLYLKISEALPVQGHRMPYRAPALNDAQITRVRMWIEQGASASCPEVPATCADTTAPTFSGAASATVAGDDMEVCWPPASDDVSEATALRYAVYWGHAAGAEDYRWTRFVTDPGASCTTIRGAAPDQTYCFVVRARDEAGNEDDNATEQCVTMPAAACVDFEATVQPILERECAHCHGGPSPVVDLSLETYAGVMAGGSSGPVVTACNPGDSLIPQKIVDPPAWGLRMPADGPPHLGDQEIAAVRSWIEQGARSACGDPDPCPVP